MQKELRDKWRTFGLLELEYSARNVFSNLLDEGQLKFESPELIAKSRGEQRQFLDTQTVPYFCNGMRQAREYFEHAFQSSLLIRPLLHYYGAMGLVKSLILLECPDFFLDRANLNHGLRLPQPSAERTSSLRDITVIVETRGIFPTAHALLHGEAPPRFDVPLSDIVSRLPDLEADIRLILKVEPGYLSLGNVFTMNREVSPVRVRVEAIVTGEYRAHFEGSGRKELEEDFEIVDLPGERMQMRSREDYGSQLHAVKALMLDLRLDSKLDGTPVLVRPISVGHGGPLLAAREAELQYMAMFAFSSLVRYHPNLWSELNSGKDNHLSVLIQDVIELFETKLLDWVSNRVRRVYLAFMFT